MADPFTWVSIIGSVVSFAGNMQAGKAAKQAGERQQAAAKFQADQMAAQSIQEQAAAQRGAIDQRRQASLIASRAVAAAGASGGGVDDPSVQNLISDIRGEGAYRAAVKLYQGEDAARQLRMGGEAKIYEGSLKMQDANDRASAYYTKGIGSGLSLMGKYGSGGPKGGLSDGIDMSSIYARSHSQNLSYAPDAFSAE
tara:strand:- start:2398 stop:2988 length:591 start_codon:yes stop_codon:yes gene_type:complete